MNSKTVPNPRQFSGPMLDGPERAPSRGMLYAVGFKKEDFQKTIVGVASTWSMVTPCNVHIDGLARESAKGVDEAGAKSIIFNTITVSDGISMGTEGMKYSLVSREVIADSIETVAGCEGFDGLVAIGGCDKNMPGCMIAIARLNREPVDHRRIERCERSRVQLPRQFTFRHAQFQALPDRLAPPRPQPLDEISHALIGRYAVDRR